MPQDTLTTRVELTGYTEFVSRVKAMSMSLKQDFVAAVTYAQMQFHSFVSQSVALEDDFERQTVRLITAFRSVEEGYRRMEEARRFAAETPFELPEVVSMYTTLAFAAQGYTRDLVGITQAAGDAAAAMGYMGGEAQMFFDVVAKASTGAREGLESLAYWTRQAVIIKPEMFLPGGPFAGMTYADAVRTALSAVFGGQMQNQMKTWTGALSNVRDQWGQFKRDLIAPFMPGLIANLQAFADTLRRMQETGEITRIAVAIRDNWAKWINQGLAWIFNRLQGFFGWLGDQWIVASRWVSAWAQYSAAFVKNFAVSAARWIRDVLSNIQELFRWVANALTAGPVNLVISNMNKILMGVNIAKNIKDYLVESSKAILSPSAYIRAYRGGAFSLFKPTPFEPIPYRRVTPPQYIRLSFAFERDADLNRLYEKREQLLKKIQMVENNYVMTEAAKARRLRDYRRQLEALNDAITRQNLLIQSGAAAQAEVAARRAARQPFTAETIAQNWRRIGQSIREEIDRTFPELGKWLDYLQSHSEAWRREIARGFQAPSTAFLNWLQRARVGLEILQRLWDGIETRIHFAVSALSEYPQLQGQALAFLRQTGSAFREMVQEQLRIIAHEEGRIRKIRTWTDLARFGYEAIENQNKAYAKLASLLELNLQRLRAEGEWRLRLNQYAQDYAEAQKRVGQSWADIRERTLGLRARLLNLFTGGMGDIFTAPQQLELIRQREQMETSAIEHQIALLQERQRILSQMPMNEQMMNEYRMVGVQIEQLGADLAMKRVEAREKELGVLEKIFSVMGQERALVGMGIALARGAISPATIQQMGGRVMAGGMPGLDFLRAMGVGFAPGFAGLPRMTVDMTGPLRVVIEDGAGNQLATGRGIMQGLTGMLTGMGGYRAGG
jgi:uncharacterized protein YdcH (DUF465 family)